MQVVSLLVHHTCPFSEPLSGHPDARVTHLCHRGKEAVLEVHARTPGAVASLREVYRKIGGKILYQEPSGTAALIGFSACACCGTGKVIPTIEGLGHLYLPPSLYSPEGERYQFLASEATLDPHLVGRLSQGVEVVRVATKPLTSLQFEEGFLVPVGTLFQDLTDRQRQAIVTAILRGYYRIPRTVTTKALAESFGISRPALEALLRKAENKLVAALFPYLTVRSQGLAEPEELRRGAAQARPRGRGPSRSSRGGVTPT